jgi:5-methylthioribose kinase
MTAQRMLTEEGIPAYLRELGLVHAGESVHVAGGGDGNINWVRRVAIGRGSTHSLVLKQARPALERFPQYAAPTERLLCEARWFEVARAHDADAVCPRVFALDDANRVLVLEDLSASERLDAALARGADVAPQMETLARFLARVHAATAGDDTLLARFANDAMRRLHGDHIFALPYQGEDFGLSPRIEAAASGVRADSALVRAAASAYARYLAPHGALVHADVQATNVLLGPGSGAKLLDAEIAHVGDPAFDLGTLLAHLALPAIARGSDASALLARVRRAYAAERACDAEVLARAGRYAGFELIRRTIGAARLAAVASDEAGLRVLAQGRRWALGDASLQKLEPATS